ncbi:N-terminal glutamine amidase-domain-containing protein [Syncephalastrum racemosum]|uniref:Protein N-terminal glutamine amidohydrolase n=1 Tax=Syncephalastrum racemosum TaxID=13706 RepID=A0A1X2HHD9_SYNRA|nr:N-terminal glutamine amidase-domain-containing protein [Syncephalastrum racemosum]
MSPTQQWQRHDQIYTKCYCEENIYMLCRAVADKAPLELEHYTVVFVSNPDKKVPFWQQSSCREDGLPVVWDYHVFLLYMAPDENTSYVYDFDTTLPFPCRADQYCFQSLRPDFQLPTCFERYFRLIPAKAYLEHFASDRSHMLGDDGVYHMPPPNYAAIATQRHQMNLEAYINMTDNRNSDMFGIVVPEKDLLALVFKQTTGSDEVEDEGEDK